jgi:molybdopterin-guanine dinucleotide biosynthesis protein A
MEFPDVTGVILAGGKSVRMGRDKAMLEVLGTKLFDRILSVMNTLFPSVIIAGNRPDLSSAAIPYYRDIYPGSSLGGLYTGLLAAETESVFVSSCDMPFPDSNIIRLILSERNDFDVVVPITPNGYEPLFALYHKNCLPVMREMIEQKNYCIYDCYSRVRVKNVSVHAFTSNWRYALMNVNTPEEYEALKSIHPVA